jgi:light-regulated signal transduction histidine kinase (bacteriophytochrome)
MTQTDADLPTVDLSECENEPIHLLEMVQPAGCVLVTDGETLEIHYASGNTEAFLGQDTDTLLGRRLAEVLDPPAVDALSALTRGPIRSECEANAAHLGLYARPRRRAAGGARRLRISARRVAHPGDTDTRLSLDLEAVPDDDEDAAEATVEAESVALAGLSDTGNLYTFLDHVVHSVAGLLDFDRVMAYSFHEDWSGEVVAEARAPDLTPFLGLRYPASDIPSQARRLYLRTQLRVIADVTAPVVPMQRAAAVANEGPLDLSAATFRSVSTYHIEYLRNMGVGATLVTSLVVNGALWGLIACHHMAPKAVPWHRREAMARVSGRVSDRIADILSMQEARQTRRTRGFLDMVRARLDEGANPLDVLFFGVPRLGEVLRADGIAVHAPYGTATTGNTPRATDLPRFLERAAAHADPQTGVFQSHALGQSGLFDDLSLCGCQGALVVVTSRAPLVTLACFRNELIREVHWGGDPNKPVELDSASQRLSPRKSFNLWREEVRGQSRRWSPWMSHLLHALARALVPERAGAPARYRALDAAALTTAVDGLMTHFEARARQVVEGFDLSENGALLARTEPTGAKDDCARRPEGDVVTACNAVFRSRFDIDETDILGRPVAAILRALGLPALVADLPMGESTQVEWWSGQGGHRTLRVTRQGLFAAMRHGGPDADEQDTHENAWVVYAFDDITQHQRTQKALSVAHSQAMAQTSARTALLSQLARDLRGPLHAIKGFADNLQGEADPARAETFRKQIDEVRALSGSLVDQLDSLLDVARMDQGASGDESIFDLTLMVSEVCQSLRGLRGEQDIAWDWHLPNERIHMLGDAAALRHAVTTLIRAALRVSPPHGAVMVRLTLDPNGEPHLSVRDSGLGLADDEIMALRHPLDRASDDAARAGAGSGRGLGLALARGLIDLHGGGVSVSSNPSHGTTIDVTLPRHRVVSHDNDAAGPLRR